MLKRNMLHSNCTLLFTSFKFVRVQWCENVRDFNKNNNVTSISALPFAEITFYIFSGL